MNWKMVLFVIITYPIWIAYCLIKLMVTTKTK